MCLSTICIDTVCIKSKLPLFYISRNNFSPSLTFVFCVWWVLSPQYLFDFYKVTQEFFGQYDLTMVNVWASWCGPCKSELPELAELYGKLPENVGFLSITVDDPQDVKEAKALLEENGCTFPCLDSQTSTGLFKNFLGKVNAIPTTVFFDRSGNEVGGWILGVPQGGDSVSDAYLQQIQNRLDQLNGK